jgi:pimeloyl-ACP methyl ester carboxylesterase
MTASDFVTAGFFTAVARRQLPLDLLAVDLDLAAISGGTALPALQTEILGPARTEGYRKVWLGGISLGAMLALCHVADTPGAADGLCLISPYPGSRLTTNAIASSGGLAEWTPDTRQLADPEFRMWRWLQKPPAGLPAFVGWGSGDRFASGIQKIAECFSPEAACCVAGGHDWPTWQTLWEHFLGSGALDD